jgi:hypothetical protein
MWLSLMCLLATWSCASIRPGGHEDRLALRAQAYQDAWRAGDYEALWRLSSDETHRIAANGIEDFHARLTSSDLREFEFETLSIKQLNARTAIVRVRTRVRSAVDNKRYEEIDDQTWVFEHGHWVFADQHVVGDPREIKSDMGSFQCDVSSTPVGAPATLQHNGVPSPR